MVWPAARKRAHIVVVLTMLVFLALDAVQCFTFQPSSVVWTACDSFTNNDMAYNPMGNANWQDPVRVLPQPLNAECTVASVPLVHNSSDPQSTKVFVKRWTNSSSTKSLWMLTGGPGGVSWELDATAWNTFSEMAMLDTPVDVYLMDHRGVGRSDALQCNGAQVDTPGSNSSESFFLFGATGRAGDR